MLLNHPALQDTIQELQFKPSPQPTTSITAQLAGLIDSMNNPDDKPTWTQLLEALGLQQSVPQQVEQPASSKLSPRKKTSLRHPFIEALANVTSFAAFQDLDLTTLPSPGRVQSQYTYPTQLYTNMNLFCQLPDPRSLAWWIGIQRTHTQQSHILYVWGSKLAGTESQQSIGHHYNMGMRNLDSSIDHWTKFVDLIEFEFFESYYQDVHHSNFCQNRGAPGHSDLADSSQPLRGAPSGTAGRRGGEMDSLTSSIEILARFDDDDHSVPASAPATSQNAPSPTGNSEPTMTASAPVASSYDGPVTLPAPIQPVITPSVLPPPNPLSVGSGPSGAPIVSVQNGINPIFLPWLGQAKQVLDYAYSTYILTQIVVTSNTTRGTVLKILDFDPWDADLVNPFAAAYGNLHNAFVGGVDLRMDVTASAVMFGKISMYFVPGPFVKSTPLTIQALEMFPSVQLDVNSSGSQTFPIRATGWEAYVDRTKTAGGHYGRVVIMCFNSIQTNFGASVDLTLNLYGGLSADGWFFNPSPDGGVSDGSADVPSLDLEGVEIVLDGKGTAFFDSSKASDRPVGVYTQTSVTGRLHYEDFVGETMVLTLSGGTDERIPDGLPTFRAQRGSYTPPQITELTAPAPPVTPHIVWGGVSPSSNARLAAVNYADFVKTANYEGYEPSSSGNSRFRCLTTVEDSTHDSTLTMEFLGGLAGPADNQLATRWIFTVGTNIIEHQTMFYPDNNRILMYHNKTHHVNITGNYQATSGYLNDPGSVPAGYTNIKLYPLEAPSCAVRSGVFGHTLPYMGTQIATILDDRGYFLANPSIKSIVTTVSTDGGASSFDILRNAHGHFVYSPVEYATLTAGFNVVNQVHSEFPTQWPPIKRIPNSLLTSRLVDNSLPAALSIMTIEDQDDSVPAALALPAIAGGIAGAAQGIGNAIGSYVDFQRQLQLSNQLLDKQLNNKIELQKNTIDYDQWLARLRYASIANQATGSNVPRPINLPTMPSSSNG